MFDNFMKYWTPDTTTATIENRLLYKWTCNAIADLLLKTSLSSRYKLINNVIKVGNRLCHPLFFQWYFTLKDNLLNGEECVGTLMNDFSLVLTQIEQSRQQAIMCQKRYGIGIEVAPDSKGMSLTIGKAMTMARKATHEIPEINVLTILDEELEESIKGASKILRTCWPEMYSEIVTSVQQLYIFRSKKVIGFVDFHSHGSIWLRENAIRTPLQLAEELIHESSHVRLNVSHALEPLFVNDNSEIYTSPLRFDPRPMFGVFHQMFVLCRLSEFYNRIASTKIPVDNIALRKGTIDERRQAIRKNLVNSYHIVEKYANMTSAGKNLMENISISGVLL
ncbi:hypothetical protein LC612_35740 [Nostoc sp. CHAB 5834]|nr:hypothetical protein [Nostoc sp. CHAB 5834]